jgi:hypothetical protein
MQKHEMRKRVAVQLSLPLPFARFAGFSLGGSRVL